MKTASLIFQMKQLIAQHLREHFHYIAGCYWDCVLSDYRKQGIGRFMVQQRLKFSQEKGCMTVVAQCLNASLNIYLNMGFQKICDMALFRYNHSTS